MTTDAQQPAFEGLEPRRRRRRQTERAAASHLPVAHVVLDIQAAHLGQPFDYLIDEKQSEAAQPGCLVRVRFGGQRVSGVIWSRSETSETDASALRFIERVLSPHPIVSASMRGDITAIADAYGGTRANIVRVAVPTRVAAVDRESFAPADGAELRERCAQSAAHAYKAFARGYEQARLVDEALAADGFASFVIDGLPGEGRWRQDFAWMALRALASGKSTVLVVPTMREVWALMHTLNAVGLRAWAPDESGGSSGDVAVLSASLSPAERYRAYRAVLAGQVRCVVGLRAAMYAPVDGPALFAVLDDAAYQYADGLAPYANARGVCRLRAGLHDGVFVAYAQARSVLSQWECERAESVGLGVCGPSAAVHGYRDALAASAPPVRWLNRDELMRLADVSVGARVPHTAVRVLSKALDQGPVLLSIPGDGVSESLSCAQCLALARCMRCTGPLERVGVNQTPRCRWCGAAAVHWHCARCGGERLRVIRVGAAGTARELRGLFREMPMVLSSPHQAEGVIEQVADAPVIVIATPGAEPRVRPGGASGGRYRAVAILDAWTSLYSQRMDARVDVLRTWMHTMSYCNARVDGGVGLLLGETDPLIAQALMTWDPRVLAGRELREREETALPPALSAACVWGRNDAVTWMLREIGVRGGDWSTLQWQGQRIDSVLGPVPIPQARTVDAREIEEMGDRVKAVVRVPHSRRAELAKRVRVALARHVASRAGGELRCRLDPKDLL